MKCYVCPTCDTYWTPFEGWTTSDPTRVYRGGARQCPDCARALADHEDERADTADHEAGA